MIVRLQWATMATGKRIFEIHNAGIGAVHEHTSSIGIVANEPFAFGSDTEPDSNFTCIACVVRDLTVKFALVVPEEIRIPEFGTAEINGRVIRVSRPGSTTIAAVSNVLGLVGPAGLRLSRVYGIEGSEAVLSGFAEAARVAGASTMLPEKMSGSSLSSSAIGA